MAGTPMLEIRNLSKRFPARTGREPPPWIIQDMSFSVGAGELLTMIGPSGAGKSTLLNIIAQIEVASAGEVVFDGAPVVSPEQKALRPGLDRRVGYVTQDDNLLPWRTTIDNVLFPLEVQGAIDDVARARAQELIDAVGLKGFEQYYPHELSGGMRKRAALIRGRCIRASIAASATSRRTTTCCPGAPPSTTCCSRSRCRAGSTPRRGRMPRC